jgi:alpha-beta hydrolase superfamily lysophospholipase
MTSAALRTPGVTAGDPVPDVLGPGYTARTLTLPDDKLGPAEATLVSRPAAGSGNRAVLYVHGYADYFFQTDLADFHVGRGEHFYALDLRRYGRSLREGQTPFDIADLDDYAAELDASLELIAADGHGPVTLMAHSTGCLITAIWLARRSGTAIDTVIFNSPFLELPASAVVRTVLGPIIDVVGPHRPLTPLPLPDEGIYGRSLHTSTGGEWDFDTAWKPLRGVPTRLGWLAAVRKAQARLPGGLGIDAPILVLCSARSFTGKGFGPDALATDVVLDADAISTMSTRLGPLVTVARIDGALHDVLLSGAPVRAKGYAMITRWLDGFALDRLNRRPAADPAAIATGPADVVGRLRRRRSCGPPARPARRRGHRGSGGCGSRWR